VPLCSQPISDVGADETGSAGDENTHRPTVGPRRPAAAVPAFR
jgi:hypothetical protein